MSDQNPFSSVQQQVLSLIAQGHSIAEAALQTEVHSNTIGNWRRASAEFAEAWEDALYEQAIFLRDRIIALVPNAVRVLEELLEDREMPAGVRLRAALAVIQQTSTTPAPAVSTGIPAAGRSLSTMAPMTDDEMLDALRNLAVHLESGVNAAEPALTMDAEPSFALDEIENPKRPMESCESAGIAEKDEAQVRGKLEESEARWAAPPARPPF